MAVALDPQSTRASAGTLAPEERLKRLLLAAELDLLHRLDKDYRGLAARLGSDAALTRSIAAVVVEVLREAGIRDHDRMAGALAPLIVVSLRQEIRNSRDMMVDALYPITGRLVAAAVKNAFRELMETLNKRLDQGLSFERWQIRVQSWTTGVSEAELLLRRYPPFDIDELLLVHRPTGLLLARLHEEDEVDAEAPDADIVSGMLTAILAFTRDAFGAGGSGELQTLSFGAADLFIRTSPAAIVAVKARGTPPTGFDRAFEELFCAFLERWGDAFRDFDGALEPAVGGDMLDDLRTRFRTLTATRPGRRRRSMTKAFVFVGMLAAAMTAWGCGASWNIAASPPSRRSRWGSSRRTSVSAVTR